MLGIGDHAPNPVEWWASRSKWAHALPDGSEGRTVQFYCGKLTAARMKNLGKKRPENACQDCVIFSGRSTT